MVALQKFLVAQASRLCCEQTVFSRTGETPVPRLLGFKTVSSSCCFIWLKCYKNDFSCFTFINTRGDGNEARRQLRLDRKSTRLN